MKHKNFMLRFYQVGSAISFAIAGISMWKGSAQNAIFAILLAIHLNMLSWDCEDCDEER